MSASSASSTMESSFATLFPQEYYAKFFAAQCRPDGRALTGLRKTVITTHDVLSNSPGASMVKIGNTTVMCGITLEVAAPNASHPSHGFLTVDVTTPALCSARLATHRGPSNTQEMSNASLSVFLRDLALNARVLRPAQLGIIEGVAAWLVRADIVVLNDDGNTRDACVLALVHAISALELPETTAPDDKEVYVIRGGLARSLGLSARDLVVPVTFAAMPDGVTLVDPTAREEELALDLYTLVFTAQGAVAGVYKPGGEPLAQDAMLHAMKLAAKRAGGWFRAAATAADDAEGGAKAGRMVVPLVANETEL